MLLITVLRINLNKKTDKRTANSRKDVEIIAPLKYLSNFWRTFEMPLINCEIILIFFGLKNVCYLMIQKQQPLQ